MITLTGVRATNQSNISLQNWKLLWTKKSLQMGIFQLFFGWLFLVVHFFHPNNDRTSQRFLT
jgi:hypothetical protein